MVFALYKSANVRLPNSNGHQAPKALSGESSDPPGPESFKVLQVAQLAVVIAARSWCFLDREVNVYVPGIQ